MKEWTCVAAVVLCVSSTCGQEFEISAMDRAGELTWTNPVPDMEFRVEWASTPDGPWSASWDSLLGVESDDATVTVSVPMCYRVVAESASRSPDDMIPIPAGTFAMGDPFGEGWADEGPFHIVTLSAFHVATTEVTTAEWDDVYGWAVTDDYAFNMPGWGKAPEHPVVWVNWYDVVKWCNARSEKANRTPCYYTDPTRTAVYRSGNIDIGSDCVDWDADGYRLPTEAEWECAARGGAFGCRFSWSDSDRVSHDRANYRADVNCQFYDDSFPAGYHPTYNSGAPYTSPVGSFAPNAYGLCDMTGNVSEWCWDWYGGGAGYNSVPPSPDPHGPDFGVNRTYRGGSWGSEARFCRVACRHSNSYYSPTEAYLTLGFRVVTRAP